MEKSYRLPGFLSVPRQWWFFAVVVGVIMVIAIPLYQGLWKLWFSNDSFNGLSLVPFMACIIVFKRRK